MVDQGYQKSLKTYLTWMLDSCGIVEEYIGNLTYEEFMQKRLIRDACLMQLQHIGETAFKIYKVHHQSIGPDHEKIVGLRHLISHDYFGITFERLWKIITISVPVLKTQLQSKLSEV